ncbi:MAG: M67 family metallopeptidase [Chloroflexaceae bacterium]|nr:M67 family metallopeptidase [Chloroflexaceae bacterium]
MALTLTAQDLEAIRAHAQQTYPEECCGLLLGTDKTVVQVIPTANSWSEAVAVYFQELDPAPHGKNDRFSIDPQTLLQVQKEARNRNLNIIGIYHSHPDHPAVPSACDRRLAWPEYSYVIVSVTLNQVRSWLLAESGEFQAEAIVIGD